MKYDTFKKKLAKLLNQAHPALNIEHRNGSKLFSALEKDLLGTVKLCKEISAQSAQISQLREKLAL